MSEGFIINHQSSTIKSLFRVGTTSYIVPDDLVANARYLAGRVEDMQLVLFDVPDGPCNYPTPNEVTELGRIAAESGLSYTVHLPLDVRWSENGRHPSLVAAKQVIDLTQSLQPWAYVLHLDGRIEREPGTTLAELQQWQANSVRALELLADWVGGPELLAVENLEGYPLDFIMPVLAQISVNRCVDVGHLWLDGHDPVPYLQKALPRTRVIHIHGLQERDHLSLAHMSPEQIERVLAVLRQANYDGVLTLEIFGENDFHSSIAALRAGVEAVWDVD
ncbi:MAG: sugar phosphate isomerase/epimerase [Anaerolineales bacterium]|nr:sugar phosphate isomerase/epimerase [Anaerolineales bacterium]